MVREIIKTVADCAGIHPGFITGPSRSREHVHARFVAILLIREMRPDLGTPTIGRLVGDRDHTSIINALRKAPAYLARWQSFRDLRHSARERLKVKMLEAAE